MPGVRDLFTQAADDVRRLVSTDSAVILSMGGVAAAVGHAGDRDVSDGLSGSGALKGLFSAGKTVGGARIRN